MNKHLFGVLCGIVFFLNSAGADANLVNGGFEIWDGNVPAGWMFSQQVNATSNTTYAAGKGENRGLEGNSLFATINAPYNHGASCDLTATVLQMQSGLTTGETYQFSFSSRAEYGYGNDYSAGMAARVFAGVDTSGGTDPLSPDIIWTKVPFQLPFNSNPWITTTIDIAAEQPELTVFIKMNLDGFVDPVQPYPGSGGSFSGSIDVDNATFSPIPEPASLLLLGSGLVGLFGICRRKRN